MYVNVLVYVVCFCQLCCESLTPAGTMQVIDPFVAVLTGQSVPPTVTVGVAPNPEPVIIISVQPTNRL